MNKDKKEVSTNKIIVLLIVVTALILFIIAFAFVSFEKRQSDSNDKKLNTGTISITYSNSVNGINMNNFVPITDEVGEKLDDINQYFDFTVNAEIDGEAQIDYEMVLEKSEDCNIDDKYIKVYLEKENEGTYSKVFEPKLFTGLEEPSSIGSPSYSMILSFGNYVTSTKDKYRLRVWIDETASLVSPAICNVKVDVYAKAK